MPERGPRDLNDPQRIIREKDDEIARLRDQLDRVQRERDRLRRENDRLKDELEAARRAARRQAAPFSKGAPRPTPKRPGRKAGRAYGRRATRPQPSTIDATIAVPVPSTCPHCRGPVEATHTRTQLQLDVPVVRPIVREFHIGIGRRRQCGRRVQARHPLQTSDALGAAAHHLGPQALALTATLHTALGVPYAKIARFFTTAFGFPVSRSTLCRALARVAARAAPTHATLAAHVRSSPRVSLDETGWKVAAHLEWLWAAVTRETTLYRIQPGRGFDEAAALIGADYAGVLVRGGWAPYRGVEAADHQTCVAHLLRRCHGLLDVLAPTTARWPAAVADLLQAALALRDRHAAGVVSTRGLAIATGQLLTR